MMGEALPTAAAILKAASKPSECEALLLEVMEYGTKNCDSIEKRSEQAGAVLRQVWEKSSDLEAALVNVFWLSSSMITTVGNTESTKSLVGIVHLVVQVKNRPSFWGKLQTNLPPTILEQVGLGSEQELLKKMKVHNTQVNYKQQKYSLLQEESEGYSKLISFLASKPDSRQLSDVARRKVLCLIGMFELDPNRVLDITWNVLESTLDISTLNLEEAMSKAPEVTPQLSRLIDIIQEFPSDKLQALVAFKVSTEKMSPVLLGTIAFLAARDLIQIGGLDQSFPNDVKAETREAYKLFWSNGRRQVKNISKLSLGSGTQEDERVAGISQHFDETIGMLKKNPILRVMLMLIHWGHWNKVKSLLPRIIWGDLCALMPKTFGDALCNDSSKKILPWKAAFVSSPGLTAPESNCSVEDFVPEKLDNVLNTFVEAIADPLSLTLRSGCMASHGVLYSQICRTAAAILEKHPARDSFSEGTIGFFRNFLLPSVCLFPSNPAVATELWAVLKHLPYSIRYQLYKQWTASDMRSFQDLELPVWSLESEAKASKEIRYLLKRLSRENVREMSRQIAKVAHSNPLTVFGTMLQQVESYDNLVDVMVESQRFVNPLGSDVLVYCLLNRFTAAPGGVDRSRLKEDGVNVSQWLQSLETFTGSFFTRFPHVELRGMICYLLRRLCDGEVMELGLLRTLLKVGGGFAFADYSPAASLSTSQLDGRAGWETLQRQTMSFGIEEEFSANAATRMHKLLDTDGLGVSILLLLAQVQARETYDLSGKKAKDLKRIGYLNDSSSSVRSILLDFLTSDDGKKDGSKENLPSFREVFEEYNLSVSNTWMFNKFLTGQGDTESMDGNTPSISDAIRLCDKVLAPSPSWSYISTELFDFFASNTLSDIYYPKEAYSSEISRVNKEVSRHKSRDRMGVEVALHAQQGNQRSDASEVNRLELVAKNLQRDSDAQKKHVNAVLDAMREKSKEFFCLTTAPKDTAVALLQSCTFPRSLQSPDDALYSAHFAFQLHAMDTPGFSTFSYLDELIPAITGSLFGCTEGEAANLAIFLWETWKVSNKWRYDEKSFEEDISNKACSGFLGQDGESKVMTHKEFGVLYSKWHAILGNTLLACLQSSEYMHTRAGLVVLARLCGVFPTRPKLGNKLLRILNQLQENESVRADIRASSAAYATMLLRTRDEGKWVEEDAGAAKARKEKDRTAAAKRKRKMKEQMQEMDRDSAKIAEGTGLNSGSRDRHDNRRQPRGHSNSRPERQSDRRRGPKRTNDEDNVESGEINGVGRGRQGSPSRRLPPSRDSGRDSRWARGESAADFSSRQGDRRPGSDSRHRDGGHDHDRGGAWKRDEGRPAFSDSRGKSGKRARPSSPQDDNDTRGERSKRARVDEGRDASPPRNRRRRNTRN
ncbi:unnamed protein product [Cylindrotheca closterium]|uniref:THO complex subunit 2 n=1 Tax=Cylindrotheca closterium TaxID=2856 RepID=A0AAD2G9W5_9STRA|nr:unnamed protein product [Cylindrotheca closterium]